MHRTKTLLTIISLFYLLFLSCSLPQRVFVDQTPHTQSTLISDSPSPTTNHTHTPEPDQPWQLGHRQQTADLPEYRFEMLVEYPYIEGSQQPQAMGFNKLMDAFVQEEIETAQSWVIDPDALDGFDAFSEVYYSLPSAVGWGQELENVDPLNDGLPLDAPLVVLDAGDQILSVLFVNFHYLGGAHPNSYHLAINYDLTRAGSLDLADLFQPGTPYLERISEYCIDTLTTEMETFDIWEDGAAPVPENYAIWGLTADGLLIVFDAYQVAPYAAGPQQVLIPYPVLADLLAPQGPLSRFAQTP